MNVSRYIIIPVILFLACILFDGPAIAQKIKAEAVVQESTVYVGDPFVFQVSITGSDQMTQPDMSGLKDFSVEYQGGSQNNRTSITLINDKLTKNISRGYVFSYRLTPRQTGTLIIPALAVQADGQTTWTRPLSVNVLKPQETDDIKLRLSMSKDRCYEGEPITFTVTWYLKQDVRAFDLTIPLLERTEDFYFIDPEMNQISGKKYYRLPLAGDEVIAEQGRASLDGSSYSTITFSKILIPKKSGNMTIDPATVTCEILTGYRKSRRSLADDFFSGAFDNDFFGTRQGIYKKIVAPSNSLRLTVNEVPNQGRPAGFAGHIGIYEITAKAAPIEINVGDPITLTLTVSGPEYIDHITFPSLASQSKLVHDFKIPADRATGETRGKTRVFTQTIRALRPDVTQIPPIELPYFDTKSGKYDIARTKPIPIKVKETRVVTALDAEGRALPAVNGNEVETWTKGIAYNYEDLSVIKNQQTGFSIAKSRIWLAGLILPPFCYFLILTTTIIIRRKNADPQAVLAKKAFAILNADLKKALRAESSQHKTDAILDALRQYLGASLKMPYRAIVFNDVRNQLIDKGVSPELMDRLKTVFDACEAGRYAGASGAGDPAALSQKTLHIAQKLEKFFK